jgi:hypothetical protein
MVRRMKRDRVQASQWDKNHVLICGIIEEKFSGVPFSVSDIMKSLTKKVEKDNKNAYAKFVHDHGTIKYTGTEEKCISRQTIRTHLKQLITDSKIKSDGRRSYTSKTSGEIGKDLLGLQAYDLVDWFIQQLQSCVVPTELLTKGKKLLKNYLLFLSGVYYFFEQFLIKESASQLTLPRIILDETTAVAFGKAIGVTVPETDIFNFDASRKVNMPKLTIRRSGGAEPLSVDRTSILKQMAANVNPYTFNVTITACHLEIALRELYEKTGKEAPALFLYRMLEHEGRESLQKVTTDLKRIGAWWAEVADYIPSSGMFRFLTVISINSTPAFKRALMQVT